MADRDQHVKRPRSRAKRRRDPDVQPPPVVGAPKGPITAEDVPAMWRLVTANQAALMAALQEVLKATTDQKVLFQKAIVKTFNYECELLCPVRLGCAHKYRLLLQTSKVLSLLI
jgi:hypothetical protein